MGNRRGGLVTPFRMLAGRQEAERFSVASKEYDKAKASKAVRSLSRQLRHVAELRVAEAKDAQVREAEQRWSYLVDATLEEMLQEAEREKRLIEFRIALLRVEPSCRALLSSVRQAAVDPTGDAAKRLLKHAVAWRKVFGPEHVNRLEAVLDLARMGVVVRNHTTPQRDLIYVAGQEDLESFHWTKKGFLAPAREYLGQGYAHRSVELTGHTAEPAVEVRGAPPPEASSFDLPEVPSDMTLTAVPLPSEPQGFPAAFPSAEPGRTVSSRAQPAAPEVTGAVVPVLPQWPPQPSLRQELEALDVPLIQSPRRPNPGLPSRSVGTPTAPQQPAPSPHRQQLRQGPLFDTPTDLSGGPARPRQRGHHGRGISR